MYMYLQIVHVTYFVTPFSHILIYNSCRGKKKGKNNQLQVPPSVNFFFTKHFHLFESNTRTCTLDEQQDAYNCFGSKRSHLFDDSLFFPVTDVVVLCLVLDVHLRIILSVWLCTVLYWFNFVNQCTTINHNLATLYL